VLIVATYDDHIENNEVKVSFGKWLLRFSLGQKLLFLSPV